MSMAGGAIASIPMDGGGLAITGAAMPGGRVMAGVVHLAGVAGGLGFVGPGSMLGLAPIALRRASEAGAISMAMDLAMAMVTGADEFASSLALVRPAR